MIKTFFSLSVGGFLFLTLNTSVAEKPTTSPAVEKENSRWTMWAESPAKRWQDAFVTGNGRHGTMVMGRAAKESITCVHEELLLAGWDRSKDPMPDIAHLLPEVRRLIRENKSPEAVALAHGETRKQLDPRGIREGWPVIPHPAFDLQIHHKGQGKVANYARHLDLETGEAISTWSDEVNFVSQRVFSSQAHNVNVIELEAKDGKKINATLALRETPGRPGGKRIHRNIPLGEAFDFVNVSAEPGWLHYHANYKVDSGGYQSAARVTLDGGEMTVNGSDLVIKNAKRVLIVSRIQPLSQGGISKQEQIKAELSNLPNSYDALLQPHARIHGERFGRVTFELGAKEKWKTESNEKLLARIKTDGVNPHFLEKTHAMGRYLLISTCGRYPAPLQGIWGAGWTPAWGGSWTTDSNVNLAISSASMGNLPECAESYFGFVERQLPGWRANARKLFGCDGIVCSINSDPETGYQTHFTKRHFFGYWPGGTGWNIRPFYDHALLNNDDAFMRDRVFPLYYELGKFYEDFLYEDEDGSLNVIPSLSPENVPRGSRGVRHAMVVENSTFDIAVAREVFTILIELGNRFGHNSEDIKRWEQIFSKLPAYRINSDGALAEWIPEKYRDSYGHRHNSHLYPIFPGHEFLQPGADPVLIEASRKALEKRYLTETDKAHGLVHIAFMSVRLNDPEKVKENLERLSQDSYFYDSFVTSHDPNHRIYNLDGALSLPRLFMEMLVYSRPGFIELLPAWPKSYADGSITKVLVRGGHQIDISWENGTLASATLYAGTDGPCEIKYGDQTKTLTLKAGESYPLSF